MPQAVIFDVDGTLVDSVDLHTHAWVDAFHDYGHEIGFDQKRRQICKGGDQFMPVFLSEQQLAEVSSHLRAIDHKIAIYEHQVTPVA